MSIFEDLAAPVTDCANCGRAFEPNGHDHCAEGSRVLITVVSRFGDVGIRGRNVDLIEHGYHARVEPEALREVAFVDDGGRPWKKELLQRLGCEP